MSQNFTWDDQTSNCCSKPATALPGRDGLSVHLMLGPDNRPLKSASVNLVPKTIIPEGPPAFSATVLDSKVYAGDGGQILKVALVAHSGTSGASPPDSMQSWDQKKLRGQVVVTVDGEAVTKSCDLQSKNKWRCIISVRLPNNWFVGDVPQKDVTVSASIGNEQIETISKVVLHCTPSTAPTTSSRERLTVNLPHRTLYPGETFEVLVRAFTTKKLATLQAQMEIEDDDLLITKMTIRPPSGVQVVSDAESGNFATFGLIRDVSSVVVSHKPEQDDLVDVTLTVAVRPLAAKGAHTISVAIVANSDSSGVTQIPLDAIVVHCRDHRDGSRFLSSGAVYVGQDLPVAIFATATDPLLVNTASLDGIPVKQPMTVSQVSVRGIKFGPVDANLLTCTSELHMMVTSLCDEVVLSAGTDTSGTSVAVVHVKLGTLATKLKFRIWSPKFPLAVKIDTPNLYPMDVHGFQSTKYRAIATFASVGAPSFIADVTATVFAEIDNRSIATVARDDSLILATQRTTGGSTRLLIKSSATVASDLGSAVISVNVGANKIMVDSISAIAVKHFSVKERRLDGEFDTIESSVCTSYEMPELRFEGDRAQIVVVAHLSDGSTTVVDASMGLKLTSVDNSTVVIKDEVYAEVPANPTSVLRSPLVKAELGGHIAYAVFSVQVKAINVEFKSMRWQGPVGSPWSLSRPGSTAEAAGVISKVDLSVVLVYPGGHRVQMELDERTQFSIAGQVHLSIDLAKNPSSQRYDRRVLSVNDDSSRGLSTVTVSFTHENLTASLDFQVVEFNRFLLSATEYPYFKEASGVIPTVLRPVMYTKPLIYEQSTVRCQAELSAGPTAQVIKLNLPQSKVRLTLDPPDAGVSIVSHSRRLVPDPEVVTPGEIDVHCAFHTNSTGETDKLTFTIVGTTDPAYVDSIVLFELDQAGTVLSTKRALRGEPGQDIAESRVAVVLTDNRFYRQQTHTDGAYLPGLFMFEVVEPSPAVSFATDSGIATILANSIAPVQFVVSVLGKDKARPSATTAVPCNLNCLTKGDIDVGSADGVPTQVHAVSSTFTLPIRINTGGKALGAFDFIIAFNTSVVGLDGDASFGGTSTALAMAGGSSCPNVEAVAVTTGVRVSGTCPHRNSAPRCKFSNQGEECNIASATTPSSAAGRRAWDGAPFLTVKLVALSEGNTTFSTNIAVLSDTKLATITLAGSSMIAGVVEQVVTKATRRARRSRYAFRRLPRTQRDRSSKELLLFPGDADQGKYGHGVGVVDIYDVTCMLRMLVVLFPKCENMLKNGQTNDPEFMEVCCRYKGVGADCAAEPDGEGMSILAKTADAHRALRQRPGGWEDFMDLDFDRKLDMNDALLLLRSLLGKRALIDGVNLEDGTQGEQFLHCQFPVTTVVFFPKRSVPYCAATASSTADCLDYDTSSIPGVRSNRIDHGLKVTAVAAYSDSNSPLLAPMTRSAIRSTDAGAEIEYTANVTVNLSGGEVVLLAIAVALLDPAPDGFAKSGKVSMYPTQSSGDVSQPGNWSTGSRLPLGWNVDAHGNTYPRTIYPTKSILTNSNWSSLCSRGTTATLISMSSTAITVPIVSPTLQTTRLSTASSSATHAESTTRATMLSYQPSRAPSATSFPALSPSMSPTMLPFLTSSESPSTPPTFMPRDSSPSKDPVALPSADWSRSPSTSPTSLFLSSTSTRPDSKRIEPGRSTVNNKRQAGVPVNDESTTTVKSSDGPDDSDGSSTSWWWILLILIVLILLCIGVMALVVWRKRKSELSQSVDLQSHVDSKASGNLDPKSEGPKKIIDLGLDNLEAVTNTDSDVQFDTLASRLLSHGASTTINSIDNPVHSLKKTRDARGNPAYATSTNGLQSSELKMVAYADITDPSDAAILDHSYEVPVSSPAPRSRTEGSLVSQDIDMQYEDLSVFPLTHSPSGAVDVSYSQLMHRQVSYEDERQPSNNGDYGYLQPLESLESSTRDSIAPSKVLSGSSISPATVRRAKQGNSKMMDRSHTYEEAVQVQGPLLKPEVYKPSAGIDETTVLGSAVEVMYAKESRSLHDFKGHGALRSTGHTSSSNIDQVYQPARGKSPEQLASDCTDEPKYSAANAFTTPHRNSVLYDYVNPQQSVEYDVAPKQTSDGSVLYDQVDPARSSVRYSAATINKSVVYSLAGCANAGSAGGTHVQVPNIDDDPQYDAAEQITDYDLAHTSTRRARVLNGNIDSVIPQTAMHHTTEYNLADFSRDAVAKDPDTPAQYTSGTPAYQFAKVVPEEHEAKYEFAHADAPSPRKISEGDSTTATGDADSDMATLIERLHASQASTSFFEKVKMVQGSAVNSQSNSRTNTGEHTATADLEPTRVQPAPWNTSTSLSTRARVARMSLDPLTPAPRIPAIRIHAHQATSPKLSAVSLLTPRAAGIQPASRHQSDDLAIPVRHDTARLSDIDSPSRAPTAFFSDAPDFASPTMMQTPRRISNLDAGADRFGSDAVFRFSSLDHHDQDEIETRRQQSTKSNLFI